MARTLRVLKFDEDRNEFPVYMHYSDEESPQPAYVELDCRNKTLSATWDTGEDDYYDHIRRYPCRNTLTTDEINGLLDKLMPLALRVVNGYRTVRSGDYGVAVLNEDAQLAEHEIKLRCGKTFVEDPFFEGWLAASCESMTC